MHGREHRREGEARRRREMPLLGEVGREVEMPPREGERELDTLPRRSSNEGERAEALLQSYAPPRRGPNEGALATCDPGGKLPRERATSRVRGYDLVRAWATCRGGCGAH